MPPNANHLKENVSELEILSIYFHLSQMKIEIVVIKVYFVLLLIDLALSNHKPSSRYVSSIKIDAIFFLIQNLHSELIIFVFLLQELPSQWI